MSKIERTLYLEKLMLFLVIQTAYLSYIHMAKPHEDPIFNKLEFINEYALIAFGYVMFIFVGLVWPLDEDTEKQGRSYSLLIILFIFSLNLLINVKIVVRRVINFFKAKCAKKSTIKQQKKEDPTEKENGKLQFNEKKMPMRAVSELVIPSLPKF